MRCQSFMKRTCFLRGLIPTMGFQSDIVYFDVKEREAGQSKYNIEKMMNAGSRWNHFHEHQTAADDRNPWISDLFVQHWTVYSCIVDWANGAVVAGWTTTVASTCLIGGITLLSQGIIGEYIGKIYMESKGRPRYIVDSMILRDAEDSAEEEQENERKD